jgi:hypothetical protein
MIGGALRASKMVNYGVPDFVAELPPNGKVGIGQKE